LSETSLLPIEATMMVIRKRKGAIVDGSSSDSMFEN
jgi:hypothetical protein